MSHMLALVQNEFCYKESTELLEIEKPKKNQKKKNMSIQRFVTKQH